MGNVHPVPMEDFKPQGYAVQSCARQLEASPGDCGGVLALIPLLVLLLLLLLTSELQSTTEYSGCRSAQGTSSSTGDSMQH